MLKRGSPPQSSFEFVSLEQLVPKDHLLRKIEGSIDFSFIHDLIDQIVTLNRALAHSLTP
jgi:hypothetical protein